MVTTRIEPNPTHIDQLMDDQVHWVCHCTNDVWSFCGLDLDGEPWALRDNHDCPLCVLAASPEHCPWGCDCDNCTGKE